jgi:hypothetical protein
MAASAEKVSVALSHEVLEWARERAKRKGTSLSAVLTRAALLAKRHEERIRRQREGWEAYLREATAEQGLSADDMRAGAAELAEAQAEAVHRAQAVPAANQDPLRRAR